MVDADGSYSHNPQEVMDNLNLLFYVCVSVHLCLCVCACVRMCTFSFCWQQRSSLTTECVALSGFHGSFFCKYKIFTPNINLKNNIQSWPPYFFSVRFSISSFHVGLCLFSLCVCGTHCVCLSSFLPQTNKHVQACIRLIGDRITAGFDTHTHTHPRVYSWRLLLIERPKNNPTLASPTLNVVFCSDEN